MDFKEAQAFFLRNRKAEFLAHSEIQALNLYFIDERGRLRDHAPDTSVIVDRLERWFLNHGRPNKIGTQERAHATARRALEEGLKKLETRKEKMARELPRHTNSLMTTGIKESVIKLLMSAGFRTKRQVAQAKDSELLGIKGIDVARLRQIRSYCPHISKKRAKEWETLQGGQGAFTF